MVLSIAIAAWEQGNGGATAGQHYGRSTTQIGKLPMEL
jgi:hypothetical protein